MTTATTTFRLRLILVAITLTTLGGCSDGASGPTPSTDAALAMNGVAYGTDAAQIMDVRLPAGRSTTTPVVLFVHGGGWEGGDKSIFTATDLAKFTARGYATVNINYRLASVPLNIHDPVPSLDVASALEYVSAHAAEYHIASSKFALVGHSAGAHLALMAAYKYNGLGRIKAVASLAGPTDLTDPAWLAFPGIRDLIERYLGVTQAAQPSRWTGASPVSAATASAPPTLLLHGKLDALVLYTQADLLQTRLLALKVPVEYRLYQAYNHDLGYVAINHFPDDVWDPTLAWFGTHLR